MHPHKVDYSIFMSVACLWIYIHFGKWENAAYVVADSSDVDVKEDDYSNHNDRSSNQLPEDLDIEIDRIFCCFPKSKRKTQIPLVTLEKWLFLGTAISEIISSF